MERVKKVTAHLCSSANGQANDNAARQFTERADMGMSMLPPEANEVLTAEQRAQYERDGFVVVRQLFTAEELSVWRDRFEDICNGRVEVEPTMLVMRDVALAKTMSKAELTAATATKIQDFQDDPTMFEFCKHPKMLQYVRAFCGDNARSIHSMLINKPPDLGKGTSRHPMHQDLYYFPLRSSNRIVGTWVCMEPRINRDNGCLSVIPGSHRDQLLKPHGYPDWAGGANALYHGILEDIDMSGRVHLEMEMGDCVFFHPLLYHGSGRNETAGFRKAISAHYASGLCDFYPAPDAVIDEGLQRKLQMNASKIPEDLKQRVYAEAWRLKSRQVLGVQPKAWDLDANILGELGSFVAEHIAKSNANANAASFESTAI